MTGRGWETPSMRKKTRMGKELMKMATLAQAVAEAANGGTTTKLNTRGYSTEDEKAGAAKGAVQEAAKQTTVQPARPTSEAQESRRRTKSLTEDAEKERRFPRI
ncbi:hypothetical protein VTI74DRAFT_1446 [Chaetomium olivicolor]